MTSPTASSTCSTTTRSHRDARVRGGGAPPPSDGSGPATGCSRARQRGRRRVDRRLRRRGRGDRRHTTTPPRPERSSCSTTLRVLPARRGQARSTVRASPRADEHRAVVDAATRSDSRSSRSRWRTRRWPRALRTWASTSHRASGSRGPSARGRIDELLALRDLAAMNRGGPRWVAWPHGRPGAVRRARDALHVGALLGRAAHDAQPVRRRGPRAGDVPARLPRLRRVQGGHEPQGLALQDPHEHVHQLVPGEEAPSRRGRPRRRRGLLPLPPPRRARGGEAEPHARDRGARRACPTRW